MQDQPNQQRTIGTPPTRPEPRDSAKQDSMKQEAMHLTDRAERAAEQVKSAAIDRVHTVRDQAQNGLDQGRSQVVERIRHVSSALKSAGNELRKNDETIARYVAAAGDKIESVASYVSSAEPGSVLRDAEDLARRKPAWFFGGAFLLGLAGGRFFKASQKGSQYESEELGDSDFVPLSSSYRPEASRRQQSYAQGPYASPGTAAPKPIQRPIAPSETVSVTDEPKTPIPGMPRGPNYT